jgi:hypothetical protein
MSTAVLLSQGPAAIVQRHAGKKYVIGRVRKAAMPMSAAVGRWQHRVQLRSDLALPSPFLAMRKHLEHQESDGKSSDVRSDKTKAYTTKMRKQLVGFAP